MFIEQDWYILIKDVFEVFYFAAGVIMVISIVLALIQFKTTKSRLLKQDERASKEKSLEILNSFASRIIPSINAYNEKIREEKFPEVKNYFNEDFTVDVDELSKEHLAIIMTKHEYDLANILNEIEHQALIINLGLANEDIVFEPLSELYCRFIREEFLAIAISRSSGVPFANIVELYTKWEDKKKIGEINKLQKHLTKLQKKIEER